MSRRGPDDEQLYRSGPLGLVFRRLSIIDVTGGAQPIENEDRTISLVVNGEIFNHRALRANLNRTHDFRSKSDCEVAVHLYEEVGIQLFEKLIGMFGLAIWDSRKGTLLLGRDRMGIKPMFYTRTETHLLFGSEIKALLAHPDCPRSFSWETALSDPLLKRQVYPELPISSYFDGIEQLPGGEVLVANVKERAIERKVYWRLPMLSAAEYAEDTRTEKEVITGYRDLLQAAVRDCLMSDAEYGLFLSGGLDSVAICAMAGPEPFHTFTVLSQSTFGNGDAEAAHFAAEVFALPNHEVLFQWHEAWSSPEQWKDLLWACETPLCGAEQLYKYHLHRYAKAIRPNLKVMLLGQGSDEFNGGYSRMAGSGHKNEHRTWPEFFAKIETWRRQAHMDRLSPTHQYLDQVMGRQIFASSFLHSLSERNPSVQPWQDYARYVSYALQMYNLWHEDRTAAANSIENRVPFLDHRIVEYTLRIPPRLHPRLFWEKRILREALRGQLPEVLRSRPKVAFYNGPDVRYTNLMILKLLSARKATLVEEAFEGSAVIDVGAMRSILSTIETDPQARWAPLFLTLTNMGLLARAAAQPPSVRSDAGDPIHQSIEITNWSADRERIAAALAPPRDQPFPDGAIAFSERSFLLRQDSHEDTLAASFVINGSLVEQCLSEEEFGDWLRVLREVDGKTSLRQIVRGLGLPESSCDELCDGLLKLGVLEFR